MNDKGKKTDNKNRGFNHKLSIASPKLKVNRIKNDSKQNDCYTIDLNKRSRQAMKTFLIVTETLIALILIFTILMHSPKGEGLGAIGGGTKLFNSSKGMEDGLTKFTTILVTLFFVIAGILGVLL
jgi:preprotein translocase subunit SecG